MLQIQTIPLPSTVANVLDTSGIMTRETEIIICNEMGFANWQLLFPSSSRG